MRKKSSIDPVDNEINKRGNKVLLACLFPVKDYE
jgi:hypothetical protein